MATDKKTMKAEFWLKRTLLILWFYFIVGSDRQYFILLLLGLTMHDFVIFMTKDVRSALQTQLALCKLRPSNQPSTDLSKTGELLDTTKKNHGDCEGELGGGNYYKHQVVCESCKNVVEQETMKAKEKYKQKLAEKEEKFKKDKSLLKDKYDEDREKWEEEINLLKKKYEAMRWT